MAFYDYKSLSLRKPPIKHQKKNAHYRSYAIAFINLNLIANLVLCLSNIETSQKGGNDEPQLIERYE
jgi:hypothetical protein